MLQSEFDDESNTSMSSLLSSSSSSLSSTDSLSSSASLELSDSTAQDSDDLNDEFADETELEDHMDALNQILPLVLSHRYLVKRVVKPKSRDFVSRVLPMLDEYDFKEQYRMFPASFLRILAYIEDHPVFHTGSEIRPQESPKFQLQVALKRFGSESSSAASWSAMSKQFGIGKGTVGDYTNRVMIALLSLWNSVVSWKNDRQKRDMRERLTNTGHAVC